MPSFSQISAAYNSIISAPKKAYIYKGLSNHLQKNKKFDKKIQNLLLHYAVILLIIVFVS